MPRTLLQHYIFSDLQKLRLRNTLPISVPLLENNNNNNTSSSLSSTSSSSNVKNNASNNVHSSDMDIENSEPNQTRNSNTTTSKPKK